MNKKIGALALGLLLLAGCSAPAQDDAQAQQEQQEQQAQQPVEDKVAGAGEMSEVEQVVEQGMVPIGGDKVQDGSYAVVVDSSSAMFQITDCTLTVQGGEMTAEMTMGGTGYRYVYMGTGEQAAAADEGDYIPFVEAADGTHHFTVPVEALDQGIDCAAFSDRKEKWYARTLLFRADSLPVTAFAPGIVTTPDSLALADGTYQVEVTLAGGSGRASVASPATLTVQDGAVQLTVVWSSPNYDYMKVDGVRYDTTIEDGHSVCTIPVSCFDWAMPVVADTVAMSQPHEIDYTLRLDAASITPAA